MKGVIFNILESFIVEGWGEDTYERILEKAHLMTRGPFIGPATYSDQDMTSMVESVCKELGLEPAAALRAFGKYAFQALAKKYPIFFVNKHTAKELLLSVDKTIHVEVRKLYAGAKTPMFTYRDSGPDRLTIEYRSERGLCSFMEGLIDGLAVHYGTIIKHRQSTCMHAHAECCTFELLFESTPDASDRMGIRMDEMKHA